MRENPYPNYLQFLVIWYRIANTMVLVTENKGQVQTLLKIPFQFESNNLPMITKLDKNKIFKVFIITYT